MLLITALLEVEGGRMRAWEGWKREERWKLEEELENLGRKRDPRKGHGQQKASP